MTNRRNPTSLDVLRDLIRVKMQKHLTYRLRLAKFQYRCELSDDEAALPFVEDMEGGDDLVSHSALMKEASQLRSLAGLLRKASQKDHTPGVSKKNAVVAMDTKGGIGWEGRLPWAVSGPKSDAVKMDMVRFVEITRKAGLCIMGRKTYDSILTQAQEAQSHPRRSATRVLPGRLKFVVSSKDNPGLADDNLTYSFESYDAAWECASHLVPEATFIGGASCYHWFLENSVKGDLITATVFTKAYDADTDWPAIHGHTAHAMDSDLWKSHSEVYDPVAGLRFLRLSRRG